MTTWKIGITINVLVGLALIIFPFLVLTNSLPDVGWVNGVEDFLIRSKIFLLIGDGKLRFAGFLTFLLVYFTMSVFLPIWIHNKSVNELDPRTHIHTTMYKVYAWTFGLLTGGGLFFLLSLFTAKDYLWNKREYKFRDAVDNLEFNNEENLEPEIDYEEPQEPQVPQSPQHIQPGYEREVSDDEAIYRKVDRLERRVEDVEYDLSRERRVNRKANETLGDIEDILNKR